MTKKIKNWTKKRDQALDEKKQALQDEHQALDEKKQELQDEYLAYDEKNQALQDEYLALNKMLKKVTNNEQAEPEKPIKYRVSEFTNNEQPETRKTRKTNQIQSQRRRRGIDLIN